MATFQDFMKLDIRVGEIIQVEFFEKAKSLPINFGLILVMRLGLRNQVPRLRNAIK